MRGCIVAFGVVFLVFGVILGILARDAHQSAERVAHLSPATARDVEQGVIGAEVLVEGVIDQRNPTSVHDFVAYVRLEYRGQDDEGEEIGTEDERWTPPLIIRVADGIVQIANDTDLPVLSPVRWRESDHPQWISGKGTKQYLGFRAGNPVMAIGRIVDGREGRAIEAEFVSGSRRNQYIAHQRETSLITIVVGLIAGGVGMAMILSGVWYALHGRQKT
ncbi:MAG: hypothetical protein NZ699_02550 [Roseiflexus sp.]|nr:hypothetical protein [Roseiflexus sp.]MCS7287992.1 hypothetical protein [Roseiflexus sp.]MDW8148056.1 hypothetical protein [Roseiflexaceae bacterium]MDW8234030.1 hypothetical protein [Roseiflexaceae bacterium]